MKVCPFLCKEVINMVEIRARPKGLFLLPENIKERKKL